MSVRSRFVQVFAGALALACLSACGGGGSAPAQQAAPPPATGTSWTPGVFAPASQFKDLCQSPRSGVDIEGTPFPDEQGTLSDELFWLRSWTHETYLWNDEVPDLNPDNYTNRVSYFNLLKTSEITPSGKPKDDFHFSEPTADFLERRNSAPAPSYGFELVILSATPPRRAIVAYTDPGTPASELQLGVPKLRRGSEFLEIDGVDFVNDPTQAGVDILNAALFPDTEGESHDFTVRDPDGSVRSFTLRAANLAPKAVNRTTVIDTPSGRVGYILFNTFSPFSSEREIADAFSALAGQGVTDLVLDLRYNGGGLLAVASQTAYMIAGPSRTVGRDFERLRFNADAGNRNPVTGEFNDPIPFFDRGLGFSLVDGTPLDALNLSRVFVLSTGGTCSASEAVINGLRGIDVEVVLIGDVTCGKPFGFYPEDNCGRTYYTIQFQGVNDKGFGDYADGFLPACAGNDDLSNELGARGEALLDAALTYRETGSCPTIVTKPEPVVTADKQLGTQTGPAIEIPEDRLDPPGAGRDLSLPGRRY